MLKVYSQASFSGELDVGGSAVAFALARLGFEGSDALHNTRVHHFDISCAVPAAVLEFTIGRRNLSFDPATTSAAPPSYFAGNDSTVDPGWSMFTQYDVGVTQPGLTHVLGQYYVHGKESQNFTEPIECLRHPVGASSVGQVFAYVIRRVDSDTAVPYHLNVWFDEY